MHIGQPVSQWNRESTQLDRPISRIAYLYLARITERVVMDSPAGEIFIDKTGMKLSLIDDSVAVEINV